MGGYYPEIKSLKIDELVKREAYWIYYISFNGETHTPVFKPLVGIYLGYKDGLLEFKSGRNAHFLPDTQVRVYNEQKEAEEAFKIEWHLKARSSVFNPADDFRHHYSLDKNDIEIGKYYWCYEFVYSYGVTSFPIKPTRLKFIGSCRDPQCRLFENSNDIKTEKIELSIYNFRVYDNERECRRAFNNEYRKAFGKVDSDNYEKLRKLEELNVASNNGITPEKSYPVSNKRLLLI